MALFSTLRSSSNDGESSKSSSSLPTVVQLYTNKAVTLDPNAKLAGHTVLTYQAIEVTAASAAPEGGEDSLFGHKQQRKPKTVQNPNLGVWNCCCSSASGGSSSSNSALVDQLLLRIPVTSPIYCFTVDLTDPSQVEPTMSVLHDTLVRLLVQQSSSPTSTNGSNVPVPQNATTSLFDLKSNQFGLAPEADPTTTTAPDESDRNKVKVGLMICAICRPTKQEDYKETQANHLILYHLRRYAAALHATLCLVRLAGEEDEEHPTLSVSQLTHLWREFGQGNALEVEDGPAALYGPGKNEDLIETVLLRNAQYPGHWDASKDSLWVALPPTMEVSNVDKQETAPKSSGDEAWLKQLQESVGVVAAPTAEAAAPSPATPKPDDAAVSSFFENLLKK